MRLRTLLALTFAAGALLLTFAATIVVSQFIAARVQIRAEAHTADLAEHLRQIIDAAKVVGNEELQAKCEAAQKLLVRDVVFCPSLYT